VGRQPTLVLKPGFCEVTRMPAIQDPLRRALYRRSGGQCECVVRTCPQHAGRRRCQHMLGMEGWKIHKLQKKGGETLRNVIALCPECHRRAEGKTY
jgi:5-methylcytosine-specific restriction endonuclease McrA